MGQCVPSWGIDFDHRDIASTPRQRSQNISRRPLVTCDKMSAFCFRGKVDAMSQSRYKKKVDLLTQWDDVNLRSRVDVSFLDLPYKVQNVIVVKHYRVKDGRKTLQGQSVTVVKCHSSLLVGASFMQVKMSSDCFEGGQFTKAPRDLRRVNVGINRWRFLWFFCDYHLLVYE